MADSLVISRRQSAGVSSIELPASKSILNRYIIMSALQSGRLPEVLKATDADDAKLMFEVVRRIMEETDDAGGLLELDCGNAGTVVRMAALLAAFKEKKYLLTGNERMLKRPVNELVEILIQIGASVDFRGEKGFLPLVVDSHEFMCNTFEVNALLGSQHLSGLLLMGPFCKNGIVVKMMQKPVSWPYVEMTLKMMRNAGAVAEHYNDIIRVYPGGYPHLNPQREADWSAAAFFLQAVALMPVGTALILEDLKFSDLQGDESAATLFKCFGVEVVLEPNGIKAINTGLLKHRVDADFINHPDLFNTWAVTAAMLNVEAIITGVKNLVYKESDRINHLVASLQSNGFNIEYQNGRLTIKPRTSWPATPFDFDSAGDHRVAMSFAMAGLKHPVILHNPYVISKSFPGFFSQIKKIALLNEDL